MTMPRNIIPGRTYLVTRRATRRHYLFRPDRDGTTQQIYWYVTAVLAKKYGVEVHAVQILSTHIHEVLTDTRGLLPAFLRDRNRLLANILKCHRGWPEEVFQRAPASCVALYGADAIAAKIAYTLANCVDAGLVDDPRDWPGVTVQVDDIGRRTIEADRPSMYLDPDNPTWPARASLEITVPRELKIAYGHGWRHVLRAVVDAAVRRARALARAAGRLASGARDRLFAVPFTRRSRSYEPFGGLNPTFAATGDRRERKRAVAERREFLQQYFAALEALRKGVAGVVFPRGAWRWPREVLPPLARASAT